MTDDADGGTDADTDTDAGLAEHAREYDPEARARALQSLLVEKELLSTDTVDEVIATYEGEIGPLNGARVVARAWTDDGFRERLLADGTGAVEELGLDIDTETMEVEFVANDEHTHNLVVCTLCSCYPWAVLGLPPTWYKTPEYRSRAVRDPRGLLREDFDLELAEDVEIQVWDSTSELRYAVLPRRPPGTDGLSEAELVELVSRDAMIGVDRLGAGEVAADGGASPVTDNRLADLEPADRPAFEAPWQARAFALAVALTEDVPWERFQGRLVEEIDRGGADGEPEAAYYRQWLRALERFVADEGLLDPAAIADRAAAFNDGDRTAHEFVHGDPHGHAEGDDHGHGHDHDHPH
jgi:nitrile hydratase alpha subunit/nitrile hydratase accessory protein